MSNFLKKYIGDKKFYKMLMGVALPIIAQNAITNFVSLLDNIMIGAIGTNEMTGVSVANQLMFVYMLLVFGGVAGAGIFVAQFFGKGDHEGVKHTMRFKLIVTTLVGILGVVVFSLFKEPLVSLYISDAATNCDPEATLNFGIQYINIMVLGLFPFAVSQAYSSTLRETGQTLVPMAAGLTAVGVNLAFNYILIFGHFGFPRLGVAGAAIATVLSRYVELAIVVLYTHISRKNKFARGLFKGFYIPLDTAKKITIKGMPLLVNEVLWSCAIAAISQCYSTRGLDVVGAMNISNTVSNLFNTVFLALGVSVSIIVGQALGSGDIEKAVDLDRKLIVTAVISGIFTGGLLALSAPFFPLVYNTEPEIQALATKFIICVACGCPLHAFLNACYFTIRSGGKTLITVLFDCVATWVVNYGTVFLLIWLAPEMPVVYIALADQLINIVKCVFGFVLVKNRTWVNVLVTND